MDYWSEREIVEREHNLNTTIATLEKELAILYRNTGNKIKKELELLYAKMMADDVTLNKMFQYNSYYETLALINKELKRMGNKEIKLLGNALRNEYIENGKIIAKYHPLPNVALDIDKAEKVVKSIWAVDGKNWSSRIWTNKAQLVQKLQQGLLECTAAKRSSEDLIKEIMEDFNQSYNNAKRLVNTELNHIQIQSTLDSYKKAGITQYRFLTGRDEKVCDTCGPLDNQVFDIDKAQTGINLPVMHANCRCSILAVI